MNAIAPVPVRRCLLVLSSIVAVAAYAAPAGAQSPAGPPGPPPGDGGALPAPPGTAPAFVPPGTPAAVPGAVTGPGLLSGSAVTLNRQKRTFSVALACQASGSVVVTARALTKVPIARASYRCAANRATAALRLSRKVAQRLARRKTVSATATVKQSGKSARLSFALRAGAGSAAPRGYWTDGHLQCTDSAGAPQAYLVEPDFTTATQTPISTRGWVAWYTAAGGWHWLGVNGENANRWDNWTANVGGIEQFHPNGAPQPIPWTWGPIAMPTGQGVFAIGVYEIVYWVAGKPEYQWQYVNAGTTGAAAAGGGNPYCAY
jgi:hypothetical protein